MRDAAIALLVVTCLTGCSKLLKKKDEPPPTITVRNVGAGIGPMKGKVRIEESHTPWQAKVLVEGAEAKLEGNGVWAPLPAAKSTPGKHTLKIEVVSVGRNGKEQRASTTAEVEVTAAFPLYALAPVKRGGTTIYCLGCKPEYADYDKNFEVAFELKAAPGDTIEWDGRRLPTNGAPQQVSFRFAPKLADTSVSDLLDFYKGIKLPLAITTPEGGKGGGASLNGVDAAIAVFGRGRGPVDTGDPNRAAGADRSMLILSKIASYKSKLVGSAEKVRDVDLVAVLFESEASRVNCGTYVNKANQTASHVIIAMDVDAQVIDRRSFARKGRRIFRAPRASCPTSVSRASSSDFVTGDTAAAETWVTSFLKR